MTLAIALEAFLVFPTWSKTAADPCPYCGELVEFGIPQDKTAMVKVKKEQTSTDKQISCPEYEKAFHVSFR